jgi:hypothetical protein
MPPNSINYYIFIFDGNEWLPLASGGEIASTFDNLGLLSLAIVALLRRFRLVAAII